MTRPTVPTRCPAAKAAQFAEPTHPLDFQRIEFGKHLVAPLFANGLQCQLTALIG